MEKSIPLKEIVGFLPYGLNLIAWHKEKEQRIIKMVAVDSEENFYYKDNDPTFYVSGIDEEHNMRGNYGILEIKPIVRNLSDLTKEITHNGETFVPIVKIAEMLGYDNLIKFDADSGYEFVEYGYVERYEDDQQPYVFGYWKDGLFGFWYDEQDDTCPINHFTSLSVINLLNELHFDIYDWINDGLAIDINTLNQ